MSMLHFMRKTTKFIINVCYLLLVISTFVGILSRAFPTFGSAYWSMEISRYAMIWMVFLVNAINIKDDNQIAVEFITDRVNETFKKYLFLFDDILMLMFLFVLLKYGIKLSIENLKQFSPSLNLPMTYVYAAVPAGAFLMILEKILLMKSRFVK